MLTALRYFALVPVLAVVSALPSAPPSRAGGRLRAVVPPPPRAPPPPAEKEDVPATGPADRRLASFDRMMLQFLKGHPHVPGAALAVARDGKLVYSRGFGHAD